MITALLLPLLMLGAPAGAALRSAGGDDPALQIWISNDRRFLPGDRAKVQVRAREDGYLLVFHVDPDGHLRVLFPIDPGDDDFVRGGRKYEVRGRGGRESFTVDDRRGRGTVYAALSHDPFRFDQFVLGDHWDYRNLAPQRLPADPEQDLNELVRRMVDGSFDYDVLTYDVLERVVYADEYRRSGYYDSYSNYDCGYSYFGCGRSYYGSPYSVSVGLFFGRPHYRRNYYDPFYYAGYDPFYDPFFYDPYYYRPYYYSPVYVYPTYAYPYYNYPYGGYYHNRNGGWSRPYTPYRFRPADGTYAGYRDRRYDLRRSVNTVYLPPTVRGRVPANANPIRRVTDERTGVDARTAAGGRSQAPPADANAGRRAAPRTPERTTERGGERRVDSRLVRPNIDARRAREPEEARSIMPDSRDRADRRDLPVDVTPRRSDATPRRAVDRPDDSRRGDAPAPQIEARPSRRDDGGARGDGGARAAPRAEPRPEPRRAEPAPDPQPQYRADPRPSDGGGDRGGYSPPARSDGGSRGGGSGGSGGGGDRGSSGSGGGDRGGARRR